MLTFERVPAQCFAQGEKESVETYRARVPGGWFVRIVFYSSGALTFYPDPDHRWDGSSLPPK
ncbi:MAG TPA: hypothetical protein VF006_09095 [Longimicrobium sp.]